MTRLPDWNARFHAFIDEVKHKPFSWDGLDCARGFASGGVVAVTGEDLAARFGALYKTPAGAKRALHRAGFDRLDDLAASLLPEIPVCFAQIGDLAAVPSDGPFGVSLGIVNGERILVLREEGLGTVDLLSAHRAFRVG